MVSGQIVNLLIEFKSRLHPQHTKGGAMKTRIKLRIPVAPPSRRHKTAKDYDRKGLKKALRQETKSDEPEKEENP